MREIVDRAMREGAVGMSTGLIYVPGTYAKTAEVVELAKVVGRHGGVYATHMRDEGNKVTDSIKETLTIGEQAGLPETSRISKCHRRSDGATAALLARWLKMRERAASR